MSPEIIEKAAAAIYRVWQGPHGRPWEEVCKKLPPQAESFRKYARAALEAVREDLW